MADYQLPQTANTAGLASSEQHTVTPAQVVLTGSFPVEADIESLAANQGALEAYTVLARNDTNDTVVVWDVDGANGTNKPIGMTAHAIPTSASAQPVSVIKTGVWNPNVLIFDESTTGATIDELKVALRERAPCFFLRAPKSGS